ncbi:hypothetical protein BC826DRAFT_968795 [Russula brevipes]|nr:hypothetical protein BC826DRAFT_968795 [Russula brevipes]
MLTNHPVSIAPFASGRDLITATLLYGFAAAPPRQHPRDPAHPQRGLWLFASGCLCTRDTFVETSRRYRELRTSTLFGHDLGHKVDGVKGNFLQGELDRHRICTPNDLSAAGKVPKSHQHYRKKYLSLGVDIYGYSISTAVGNHLLAARDSGRKILRIKGPGI